MHHGEVCQDPFELTLLEREYIAYVLSCYFQCGRCLEFHERAVNAERRKHDSPPREWQAALINATLFLPLGGRKRSPLEWQHCLKVWSAFKRRLHARHAGLASSIAYAIGIVRRDKHPMDHAFESISEAVADTARLKGTILDIDGVVMFMNAATSKSRSDPAIIGHLQSRGVEDVYGGVNPLRGTLAVARPELAYQIPPTRSSMAPRRIACLHALLPHDSGFVNASTDAGIEPDP